jgi:Domain of unknown function (DUF4276)
VKVCPIVEGHGDVQAVPILLRRIGAVVNPATYLDVVRPIRIPKEKLLKHGELERATRLASLYLPEGGIVFTILDCERPGCPAQEGPALLARMTEAAPDHQCAVVLAHQEFETWFLTAARSLAGYRGLPQSLEPPGRPEDIRGAKEWLTRQMAGSIAYSETLDQPRLASRMDLEEARRSDSFDKLWREVARMFGR